MESHPYPLTRLPDAWIAAYKLQLINRIAVVLAYGNHLIVEEARLRSASIRFTTTTNLFQQT